MPPAAPSQVFFGLICGARAWRPKAIPESRAPVSQNFATATSQMQRMSRPSAKWRPRQRREDADQVLEQQGDVNQAEDRRTEGVHARLRRPFAQDPDRQDDHRQGEQGMGRRPEPGLKPGRDRDQDAEKDPEQWEGRPAGRRLQPVEFAQRQGGEGGQQHHRPGRAKKPQP